MRKLYAYLVKKPVIRYLLTGGLSFAVELAMMYLFIFLGTSDIVAVAIAFWIGLVVSFLLQKVYTFNNHSTKLKHLTFQTVGYGALVLFNYAFTLYLVVALGPIIGVLFARTSALIITTAWNFVMYKKVIFTQPKS